MMSHRSYISSLAVVAIVGASAAHAQAPVAIPATPAGAIMKQWLDMFNAADSAGLETFARTHIPRMNPQVYLQARRMTGGFDLVRILTSEPSRVVFTARAKTGGSGLRGDIELEADDPSQIKTFTMRNIPPGAPLEGCTTYTSAPTSGTSAADVASEDAIIAALYEAISGPPCQHRDWDRFRGLFAPGGRLIPTIAAGDVRGIRAQTPDEYVATVKGGMEDLGFFEKEISHVGESFNGVVHRFSTYESRRAANEPAPFARGINSIQLLNDGKRWWVVTVYWAAERAGAPIPPTYLGRPPRER